MSMFMRGIARVAVPKSRSQVSALRIADLRVVCRHLQSLEVDEAYLRDRAILALSAQGLSDGAISRLDWLDTQLTPTRINLRIRPLRSNAVARSLAYHKARTKAACPVDALNTWRAACGGHGPVFTSIGGSAVAGERLSPKAVYLVRRSRLSTIGDRRRWPNDPTPFEVLSGPPSEVLRDRAVLLLGFAGAFRRVDLTRLRWGDLIRRDDGLIVHLRRSKTDVEGRGKDVGIPRGKSRLTCPVRAVEAWRSRMELLVGTTNLPDSPVFVRVGRSGRIGTEPMTPEALTYMVKKRTQQAGLTGRWGGRSLRAGFISTAADLDIPLELIAEQSRHANLDSLILYIRNDDPLRRNSAARLGM
jgi:integrase